MGAVLALTAALQATPAGAMVSDEGVGVCEKVPGIEGGWNFTTGQQCSLGEDAGGGEDSSGGAIEVEATPNPNAIVGEPIYVHEPPVREPEPKLKQLCRDLDCTRKGPGRSAVDRDHFGTPDGPKRGSVGKKEKAVAKKAEAKPTREECLQLGLDGFVWNSPEGRLMEAGRIRDEIQDLRKRIEVLSSLEKLSGIGDGERKSLEAQRDSLQKQFNNIEPSRYRYQHGNCAQIMREPRAGAPDKGPRRR